MPNHHSFRAGAICRTPHGVRGLKLLKMRCVLVDVSQSHPTRGAWIEILSIEQQIDMCKSHPTRGAWIEMQRSRDFSI